VIQAISDAAGVELSAHSRTMTSAMRSGEDLPEHLVAQMGNPEDH
jgi:hypothetical protein